jgi:hypothetical protein
MCTARGVPAARVASHAHTHAPAPATFHSRLDLLYFFPLHHGT